MLSLDKYFCRKISQCQIQLKSKTNDFKEEIGNSVNRGEADRTGACIGEPRSNFTLVCCCHFRTSALGKGYVYPLIVLRLSVLWKWTRQAGFKFRVIFLFSLSDFRNAMNSCLPLPAPPPPKKREEKFLIPKCGKINKSQYFTYNKKRKLWRAMKYLFAMFFSLTFFVSFEQIRN